MSKKCPATNAEWRAAYEELGNRLIACQETQRSMADAMAQMREQRDTLRSALQALVTEWAATPQMAVSGPHEVYWRLAKQLRKALDAQR